VVLKLNEYVHENIDSDKLDVFFEVSKQINELLDNPSIYKLKTELAPTDKK
jgi:hypothetical protein